MPFHIMVSRLMQLELESAKDVCKRTVQFRICKAIPRVSNSASSVWQIRNNQENGVHT